MEKLKMFRSIQPQILGVGLAVSSAIFLLVAFMFKNNHQHAKKLKRHHHHHRKFLPLSVDPRLREAVIINEIQVAENLMAESKMEEAILHFARAISACSDPWHLMNCLRQTLPPDSYDFLIRVLVRMYDGKQQSRTTIKSRK